MPPAKQIPTTNQQPECLKLDDGTILDERQTKAVFLIVTGEIPKEKIAKAAGYASKESLATFLRSQRGRDGVAKATSRTLAHAGAIGLNTLISVAQSSKSDVARVSAATKLVELAGIKPQSADAGSGEVKRDFSININFASSEAERHVTVAEQHVTVEGKAE